MVKSLQFILIAFAMSISIDVKAAVLLSRVQSEWQNFRLKPAISFIEPTFLSDGENPENRYLLNVHFGKMSKFQFQSLQKYFNLQSHVQYAKDREYNLIDFLSPAMQALVNHAYIVRQLDLSLLGLDENYDHEFLSKPRMDGIYSSSNCMNATYEITRLSQLTNQAGLGQLDLFGAARESIGSNLLNQGSPITSSKLRPGDVILYLKNDEGNGFSDIHKGDRLVQHSVIYLSPSLVFEKTDTDSKEPFRIGLRTDVEKRLRRVFPKKGTIKIVYRRFETHSKKLLRVNTNWIKEYPYPLPKDVPVALKNAPLLYEQVDGDFSNFEESIAWVQNGEVSIDPTTERGTLKLGSDSLGRFMLLDK